MNPTYDYDLIVIGAGIAGMVSAVTANGLGKRVAVSVHHPCPAESFRSLARA